MAIGSDYMQTIDCAAAASSSYHTALTVLHHGHAGEFAADTKTERGDDQAASKLFCQAGAESSSMASALCCHFPGTFRSSTQNVPRLICHFD